MDKEYKGTYLNIAYKWEDAIVLKKELEEYLEVIKEFLPSMYDLYRQLNKYVK